MAKALAILSLSRLPAPSVLGHVAWGFELPNGAWSIGGIESDLWEYGNRFNGFWIKTCGNLAEALKYFGWMKYLNAQYDYYRLLELHPTLVPRPDFVDVELRSISRTKYRLIGANCLDAVYRVFTAFAGGDPELARYSGKVLPSPHNPLTAAPAIWFKDLNYAVDGDLPKVPPNIFLRKRISTPTNFSRLPMGRRPTVL